MRNTRRTIRDLTSLADATRYSIFSLLHELRRPVTAQEIAEFVDISPKLSRFHLEALLKNGLLKAHYSRPTGRAGPGAGRTSKLYEPTDREVQASIPHRNYELAGSILVEAVATSAGGGDPKRNAMRVARLKGRDFAKSNDAEGMDTRGLITLLERIGYEPTRDEEGNILLTNCPFHQLAEQNRSLVCSINKAFVEGITTNTCGLKPKLEPEPRRCCVVLEQIEKDKER